VRAFQRVPNGAVPDVAVAADDRLRQPGAAGVADFVHGLLARGATIPRPRAGSPSSSAAPTTARPPSWRRTVRTCW
jgi:hypothetical protein